MSFMPRPVRAWALFTVALCVSFCVPLYGLVRFAAAHEMFSHILLIPVISLYLLWFKREEVRRVVTGQATASRDAQWIDGNPGADCRSRLRERWPGFVGLALGTAVLAFYGMLRLDGAKMAGNDALAATTFAFLCFLVAGGFLFLGQAVMRQFAFPVVFLIFMVPIPTVVLDGLEIFFQYASAEAASLTLSCTRVPVLREGLVFVLPGITIQVAQECSGIRSSLVLFITSLLAGHLFLRCAWKKVGLALFVIPLGIARNCLRICTIALLCVHVDPNMINSPLHKRGGPVFFALSLVPFFALLLWLRRSERKPKLEPMPATNGSRSP